MKRCVGEAVMSVKCLIAKSIFMGLIFNVDFVCEVKDNIDFKMFSKKDEGRKW